MSVGLDPPQILPSWLLPKSLLEGWGHGGSVVGGGILWWRAVLAATAIAPVLVPRLQPATQPPVRHGAPLCSQWSVLLMGWHSLSHTPCPILQSVLLAHPASWT